MTAAVSRQRCLCVPGYPVIGGGSVGVSSIPVINQPFNQTARSSSRTRDRMLRSVPQS